ncbi:WLM-domain-containing protein [Eremomyces bilateralis CBS 781.70]|uniref:WLM-domain-containing protein n=1 Tax=Eremomyces bilateralis CBS 781.70 TaxID=1392243 RepID=A0A6G1FZN1_9PEZI|nr:WLM-domain-containing protein [Eremomyces bilateralis CBS 781.70]KAF1811182.1 WLM-domain-containing protein [Eremomyces bilateralis CBS 781.70]
MPLGWERINEKTQRPNALINFIRPLPGASEKLSQDFLERVAAIVYPIMKRNHIVVNALEEFPWNREFVGRNFNAGEAVQLVLRAKNGAWMPFRHVQMVMIHELAHCKEMNHGKNFWKVRDGYADELRALWTRNYTGEGFWGRGQTLLSGQYTTEVMPDTSMAPEHICGGTYRSARRKRKRGQGGTSEKPKLSYAERQQRRILKKFGSGGVALGDDETKRVELEGGKKVQGKPRVAGSARGRELRAAAALARFDNVKKEKDRSEAPSDGESDTESEYEEETESDLIAVDEHGKRLTDSKGRGFVKICETEDNNDVDSKREMDELQRIDRYFTKRPQRPGSSFIDNADDGSETEDEELPIEVKRGESNSIPRNSGITSGEAGQRPAEETEQISCNVCSYLNPSTALICEICSNVLKPSKLLSTWRCQSSSCKENNYINPGDAGVCGACGASKNRAA